MLSEGYSQALSLTRYFPEISMRAMQSIVFSALLLALCIGCGGKPATDAPAPPPGDFKGSKGGPLGSVPTAARLEKAPEKTTPGKAATSGIEGNYIVVGAGMFGMEVPAAEIAKWTDKEKSVKITKDVIEFYPDEKKMESVKYKVDSTKSPPEIDTIRIENGKELPKDASYGIYKIEGDTLKIFIVGGKDAMSRPKEFSAKAGGMYLVLKKK